MVGVDLLEGAQVPHLDAPIEAGGCHVPAGEVDGTAAQRRRVAEHAHVRRGQVGRPKRDDTGAVPEVCDPVRRVESEDGAGAELRGVLGDLRAGGDVDVAQVARFAHRDEEVVVRQKGQAVHARPVRAQAVELDAG